MMNWPGRQKESMTIKIIKRFPAIQALIQSLTGNEIQAG